MQNIWVSLLTPHVESRSITSAPDGVDTYMDVDADIDGLFADVRTLCSSLILRFVQSLEHRHYTSRRSW